MEKTTVKLIGEILESNKDEMLLETIGIGKGGEEYIDEHYLRHDLPEPPKAGEWVEIIGHTEYDPEDGTVWIEVKTCKPVVSTTPSVNLARAEGEAVGVFQFFEKNEGKMSFGNGLIRMGSNRWQRGVAFGYLAHKLSKSFMAGAVVRLAGRLRKQEYEKNGETREMYEIVLDPAHTKILKAASGANPYDFDTENPIEEPKATGLRGLLRRRSVMTPATENAM